MLQTTSNKPEFWGYGNIIYHYEVMLNSDLPETRLALLSGCQIVLKFDIEQGGEIAVPCAKF